MIARRLPGPRSGRATVRAIAGIIVLCAWLAGMVVLIRQEYFRPRMERLAEAALRVGPAAVFYGVNQGDHQVGFASSTVDTSQNAITVDDYLVADIPLGGKPRRASARTKVTLSRSLRVRAFDVTVEAEGPPVHAVGNVHGDSALDLAISSGGGAAETQHIPLSGPILLPTLLPLAVALGEQPKVGKRYVLPVFDPSTMKPHDVSMDIRAESLFVVNDSSVYDSTAGRWRGTQPDTLHAWQVAGEGSGAFSGWIDEQGRIVQTQQLGFTLHRLPYEVAFENWRIESARDTSVTADRDILEISAIAANKRLDRRVADLRVRLTNVDLTGFDLQGGRQRLVGDTLLIRAEDAATLNADYLLPYQGYRLDSVDLRKEPLLQIDATPIRELARGLAHGTRDPVLVAQRIAAWVHDSIHARVTFGVPNALTVLNTRVGDCNEHTQLFVALARAAGIPTRAAAGLAYIDGKFYYHAWPEILLHDWVAIDPTFGQFPADAAHLRFVSGGLQRQTELLRLIGNLHIQVISAK